MKRFALSLTMLLFLLALAFQGCSSSDTNDSADASEKSSNDATLASLSVSVGSLSPDFDGATTSYVLKVPHGTAEVTITSTASDPKATIKVNGSAVDSGKASRPLTVPEVGSSLDIAIVVTASDGDTTETYAIALTQKAKPFAVYSIGDSTMANYQETDEKRGWGQMFPQFLVGDDVTFVNAAVNGRSSKSFYLEGLWDGVKAKLKQGDYVFIQFGHNDEKDAGLEGSGGIGTTAWGAYHEYLTKYVDETRDLGATPVLFTPVVRLDFSGTSLSAKSCHDLTGNGTAEGDANYVASMKDVGAQKECSVIDITASTQALVQQYGAADAKAIIYVSTDNTHLQPLGATMFAQLAVKGLIDSGILVDYLNPVADLIVSPSALDFGDRYLATTMDKAVTVTGLSMTPEEGNVIVTAPEGFLVSAKSNGTFTSSVEIAYTGGRLAPTDVFIRFQPVAAQDYSGDVTFASGSGTGNAKSIAVTGHGVPTPEGATESTVVYPLKSDGTCTATGFAACAEESLSNLYVKGYAVPNSNGETVWVPSAPAETITQRITILNTVTQNEWSAEIDAEPTRYVQFEVSPTAGKALTIDTISLYAGAAGGKDMAFRIQYSTQSDFNGATELAYAASNVSYTMTFLTYSLMVVVNPGETLYLRIFPWYKKVATGKYLCLQSLTIHGMAQ